MLISQGQLSQAVATLQEHRRSGDAAWDDYYAVLEAVTKANLPDLARSQSIGLLPR